MKDRITNQKIALTDEQDVQIRDSGGIEGVKLSDVPVSETFKIGKYEFVVLEHANGETFVVLKGHYGKMQNFGKNNNYAGSNAERVCNEFGDKIAEIIGADNLVEHTVDLTALDGLRDYGEVKSYMSPLTLDLYRRYANVLGKYKLSNWWWLATPYSTNCDYGRSVCCIYHDGTVFGGGCDYNGVVRPFCILKSSICVAIV